LRGDTGFRAIAGRFRYVQRLAVNDLGVLQDVDTAGDLQ
jgi:CTP:molybdopterin cytidylyltransferase MocA